jgi:hypothetical protein
MLDDDEEFLIEDGPPMDHFSHDLTTDIGGVQLFIPMISILLPQFSSRNPGHLFHPR